MPPTTTSEYLVISRGQWDANAPKEEIQTAIDDFYVWLDRMVQAGKMRPGQRLADRGKIVARNNVITDGPFGETKEVIGGYWFILAGSLEEAAEIAQGNPCMRHGLFYEIRPLETVKASAFAESNENLGQRK
jgi:hypothetical protein